MEYSNNQLKCIQREIKRYVKAMEEDKGFGVILNCSAYATWVSHAILAGYSVDKTTGAMYKQDGNVRTYFE